MANYTIVLTDEIGSWTDTISDWQLLQYTRNVNEIGTLTLVIDGNYPIANLKIDRRILVQRQIGSRIYTDTNSPFLIRRTTRKLDARGKRTIEVLAFSAVELLARRIIAYNKGTSQSEKTAEADDMIKEIMRENFGADATNTDRDMSAYLTIQTDATLGPSITKEFPRDNIMDVIQEIALTTSESGSPVFFDIVSSGEGLEFQTFRGVRGIDNTFTNGGNPVILSPNRGNLVDVTRAYDYSNEINFAYAGGTGTGANRTVETACSINRINQSPFNRREMFVSESNTDNTNALIGEAEMAVRADRPRRTFEGTILNVPGATEYGIHWAFGDKVTAEFENESIDCFVDGIAITVKGGRETIRATLRADED